ncbi:hypothetical protein [Aurantibacillus circumpalustris]|uniref:hypothetical protein n=1 Tax=Aurantibacillus circumpalustris TaxID=3036359 RepID=UPI00295BAEDA|nr:hypothetical protein [Aurantibacillus circumpalustris]
MIPAFGFVGCHKSGVKPRCGNHSNTESKSTSESTSQASGKFGDLLVEDDNTEGGAIVGSGDDDRDGGDKPKKIGR